MIEQIENAIRAIVRDELAKAFSTLRAPGIVAHNAASRKEGNRSITGQRVPILNAVASSPVGLTSIEIAEATYSEDCGTMREWRRSTVQTVFQMKRDGLLHQTKGVGTYRYSITESGADALSKCVSASDVKPLGSSTAGREPSEQRA